MCAHISQPRWILLKRPIGRTSLDMTPLWPPRSLFCACMVGKVSWLWEREICHLCRVQPPSLTACYSCLRVLVNREWISSCFTLEGGCPSASCLSIPILYICFEIDWQFFNILINFFFFCLCFPVWESSIDLISISMIFSLAESDPLMSPSKAILTSITMVLLSIISLWFILRYFVSAYITHLSLYLVYFPWELLTVVTVILNSLFDNYKIFVISESGSDACFVS